MPRNKLYTDIKDYAPPGRHDHERRMGLLRSISALSMQLPKYRGHRQNKTAAAAKRTQSMDGQNGKLNTLRPGAAVGMTLIQVRRG